MTRNTITTLSLTAAALAAGLLTTAAPAQDAASTLVRLTERSTDIVKVRVLNVRTAHPLRTATFKVQKALRGSLSGHFELSEPAGHACGRALLGVVTGASYVLFLDNTAGKPTLTVSSSRAVLSMDGNLLRHVTALTGAKDAAARSEILSRVLTSPDPRIRRDAATALAVRPGLETATNAFRARVEESLGRSLTMDTRVAAPLLQAAVRLRLQSATPNLVAAYLGDATPALAPMLHRAIVTLDRATAVATIERALPTGRAGRTRAIALLADCGSHATDCLKRLAASEDRGAAVQASRVLAEREESRPRFRGIRPHARVRTNR